MLVIHFLKHTIFKWFNIAPSPSCLSGMYHSYYVWLFFFFILITPLFISNIFLILRLHLCCIPFTLIGMYPQVILQCCGLNVCVSSNLYIEILIPNVTILGSRVFKRS